MARRTSSGRSSGPTCFGVEGKGGAARSRRTGGLGRLGGDGANRCMALVGGERGKGAREGRADKGIYAGRKGMSEMLVVLERAMADEGSAKHMMQIE